MTRFSVDEPVDYFFDCASPPPKALLAILFDEHSHTGFHVVRF